MCTYFLNRFPRVMLNGLSQEWVIYFGVLHSSGLVQDSHKIFIIEWVFWELRNLTTSLSYIIAPNLLVSHILCVCACVCVCVCVCVHICLLINFDGSLVRLRVYHWCVQLSYGESKELPKVDIISRSRLVVNLVSAGYKHAYAGCCHDQCGARHSLLAY